MKFQEFFREKKEKQVIEVQCISTSSGFHSELKLGKWYNATDDGKYYIIEEKLGISSSTRYPYEKKLFRTKSQRRDQKINKLFSSI